MKRKKRLSESSGSRFFLIIGVVQTIQAENL
jgi:hypothetical protein